MGIYGYECLSKIESFQKYLDTLSWLSEELFTKMTNPYFSIIEWTFLIIYLNEASAIDRVIKNFYEASIKHRIYSSF